MSRRPRHPILVILGVLIAIGALLDAPSCDHPHGNERGAIAAAHIASLGEASEKYHEEVGFWPMSQDDLLAKKLIKRQCKDPWTGSRYRIRFTENGKPLFYTLGHNQKP